MFKLPEKYRKKVREYKNMSPEEKKNFEDDFITYAKEKSPIVSNMSDEEVRRFLKIVPSIIDTKEE